MTQIYALDILGSLNPLLANVAFKENVQHSNIDEFAEKTKLLVSNTRKDLVDDVDINSPDSELSYSWGEDKENQLLDQNRELSDRNEVADRQALDSFYCQG